MHCPSLNPWSSRHWYGTELPKPKSRYREFRIVVKTIAGKSYEITELEGYYRVGVLKIILRHRITPTPSMRRMSLIFENNMLDDSKRLREYNICEGSEIDLVLLAPPRRSRSRSRSRCLSPMLREGSPTRVYSLEVCREV